MHFDTFFAWLCLSLRPVCSLVLDWWLWNTSGSFSTSLVALCSVSLLEPPWGEEPLAVNCGLVMVPLIGVVTVCGECDGDIGEGGEGRWGDGRERGREGDGKGKEGVVTE